MEKPAEEIQIENVVASSNIRQEIDLELLAEDLVESQYEPENFPGLVFRMQEPKATVLIFHSGKIVCTGATSLENAMTALNVTFEILRSRGIQVADDPDIEIQNIVSSADLGHTLNLNEVAIGLGIENIEYEPEQFPGLVYRLDDLSIVALLFSNGKLVITGGDRREDAEQALSVIKDQLADLGVLD